MRGSTIVKKYPSRFLFIASMGIVCSVSSTSVFAESKSDSSSKFVINYGKSVNAAYSRAQHNSDRSWSAGYVFRSRVSFDGPDLDANGKIKIVWADGSGKELGSALCKIKLLEEEDTGKKYAIVDDCGYQELKQDPQDPTKEKPVKDWLKHTGAFQTKMYYVHSEGDSGQEMAVTQGKIGKFWSWRGKEPANGTLRDVYVPRYLPLGNDTLGSSVLSMDKVDPIMGLGKLTLRFWGAHHNQGPMRGHLKCTANNKEVEFFKHASSESERKKELELTLTPDSEYTISEENYLPEGSTHYEWSRYKILLEGLTHGTKNKTSTDQDARTNLTDYGNAKWVCTLSYQNANSELKPIRKFHFQVKIQNVTLADRSKVKQGVIVPHEEQINGGLFLGPGKVFIETEFPSINGGDTCDNGFDFSIQAEDIRATGFSGRPWKSKRLREDLWKNLKSCGKSEPSPVEGTGIYIAN